jgi:uncharacterized protein YecE (DUF72 family)
MATHLHIGTSGWNYKHWANDEFYPKGLAQAKWLEYYARFFDTVEINNSFYRLPKEETFRKWRSQTPAGFVFTAKASRFFTHMKKLADPEQHAELFLERARGLGEKLKVILFQLPPQWGYNQGRLEALFRYMKRQRIMPGVRSALEVRNATWLCDTCLQMLRKHNVSLVLMDAAHLKVEDPATADFVFLRRHGTEGAYGGSYPEPHLKKDAERIRGWLSERRDVFIYYNNDIGGHAVRNAQRLKELLGDAGRRAA